MSWSNPRGWGGTQKSFIRLFTSFIPAGIGPLPNKILSIVLCLRGGKAPTGSIPYRFVYHLRQKRYPLRITFFYKWYPIHIPRIQLSIPLILTAVDALSFKYEKEITIPGNLFTFFIGIVSLISSFRSFYRRKRHISLPFHILHLVKSLPFHTSEA